MERPSVIPARGDVRNGRRTGPSRVTGGQVSRAAAAFRRGRTALEARLPLVVIVFIISTLIPNGFSIYLGSLRLTPYRLVLLVCTPILIMRAIGGEFGRFSFSDRLIVGAAIWMWVALIKNDGGSAIETGGIVFVETLGPYLIGRCCIRTASQWIGAVTTFGVSMAVISVPVVMESLTGQQIIRELAGPRTKGTDEGDISMRMGLHRAHGPFDHPILLGVTAATFTVAMAHVSRFRRSLAIFVPASLVTALCSVSSGALAVLGVTAMLSAWDHFARSIPRRWVAFLFLFAIAYLIIELLSTRSAIVAVLSVATLNPNTAYGRTIIWEWGFHQNAVKNPFFGLGMSKGVNWVRPSWLGGSIDNYFLYLMIFNGIVASVLLQLGILIKVRNAVRASAIAGLREISASWWIPMVGFVIAGWTVALWNQAQVLFWFMAGAGCWIEQRYAEAKARGELR
jgi:hypothetical protein